MYFDDLEIGIIDKVVTDTLFLTKPLATSLLNFCAQLCMFILVVQDNFSAMSSESNVEI